MSTAETERSTYANLTLEKRDAIAIVTVSRPEKLNALNRATLGEIDHVFSTLAGDPGVRAIVVTGAGEKSFVAGADIGELSVLDTRGAEEASAYGSAIFRRIERSRAPVIAAVNGFALGGGCELMLACDFAIASSNAKLGQPEVKLGVTAGFGGTTRLSRRVGRAMANQLLFTGETIDAERAAAIGLVNEVVPKEGLRARVDALAQAIVDNAPLAVAATKRAVRIGAEADLATANAYEQEIFGQCFSTADQKEGMRAFTEKRKASWEAK